MKFLTIFTPTYNRAYTLHKLYESLLRQTDRDFEWLIVDDGSTDQTKERVEQWISQRQITIRYYYQENAGKMRAHNKGAVLADSELFVCIDSDDFLTDDAVASIRTCWTQDKGKYGGIIGRRLFINKDKPLSITQFCASGHCTLHGLYDLGFKGDTTLVFRTEVLRKYPFPEIEGEKFITEAVAYDMIDLEYEYLLLDQGLTICEYMPDGYTANAAKAKLQYPKGWAMFFNQRAKYYSPSQRSKIRNTVFYIMFARRGGCHTIYKSSNTRGVLYLTAWLISLWYQRTYWRKLNQALTH